MASSARWVTFAVHSWVLAESSAVTVVAEGVEDATTQAALEALGCETAQGYYYARPQPADALTFAEPTAHAGL